MHTLRGLLAAPLDPAKRECTSFPWWFIFDPIHLTAKAMNARTARHFGSVAVDGPFFSRETAEAAMDANRHNLGPNAWVYCASGYLSSDYKALLELAKAEGAEWPAVDSEPCPCCHVVTFAGHTERVHAPGCVLDARPFVSTGTLVQTERGPVSVEDLQDGDRVHGAEGMTEVRVSMTAEQAEAFAKSTSAASRMTQAELDRAIVANQKSIVPDRAFSMSVEPLPPMTREAFDLGPMPVDEPEPMTPRDKQTFIAFFKGAQAKVHENAKAKGWWDEERPESERIALMHSELSEALEGLRHGNPPSEHIPEFTAAEEEYADTVIRIMDNAAAKGHRVAEAIIAKMAFNATREHRHGGKAF